MKLGLMLAVAATAISLLGSTVSAQPTQAKKKILVVSHTTGFRHSSIPTAEKIIKQIGDTSGIFDVEYCRNGDDVKKMLTPEYLNSNHFDGVFFANTTGNLGIPDTKAFAQWIKDGHAYFGAHSAGDTYHPQDAAGDTTYIDLISAEFRTHGRQAEAVCINEDPKHPANKAIGAEYKVTDEIYHYKVNHREDVHVLLALKVQPNDGVKDLAGVDGSNKPTDMLISWCKNVGKGKVFYTALGHREDVWESEAFQKHILGAIKWGLGLERGSGRPQGKTPPTR